METGFREYGKGKSIFDAGCNRGRKFAYDFEDAFQKNQGALALLQKSILDEAKKKLEEPFYILPVSIFELMIVPESQADEVEEMKKRLLNLIMKCQWSICFQIMYIIMEKRKR